MRHQDDPSVTSSLRDLLHLRTVLGTFLKLSGLEPVEIAAEAGLDLVVLDLEHSLTDMRTAYDQLGLARALGLPALVRVDEVDAGSIGRLLDAGAAGVQLAGVRDRVTIDRLVRAAHFPPEGDRGLSTSHRTAGYGTVPASVHVTGPAARPVLVVQVESVLDDAMLEQVVRAPVDVVFVGPLDLSVAVGAPGEFAAPALTHEVNRIAEAATRAGTLFGQHVVPGLPVHRRARLLTAGTDVTVLRQGLHALNSARPI